jgi:tRNA (guanine37-N1)-methyltransferase
MRFDVLTIFPDMFACFWEHGIIRRAIEQNIISAAAIDIRRYTQDRHRTTDDRPYGGGCGMVMKPEPLAAAIRDAQTNSPGARTILLTPQGRGLNQHVARDLVQSEALILVCGRYEGIDERIYQEFIDEELSIGDYVLSGGEVAAMVVMDAVTRLIPGALGCSASAEQDSFSEDLLDCAHYTRPPIFEGEQVPSVLLSGNHREIDRWRLESALIRTLLKRPDLLEKRAVSEEELGILTKWMQQVERIIRAQSIPGSASLSGGQSKR